MLASKQMTKAGYDEVFLLALCDHLCLLTLFDNNNKISNNKSEQSLQVTNPAPYNQLPPLSPSLLPGIQSSYEVSINHASKRFFKFINTCIR